MYKVIRSVIPFMLFMLAMSVSQSSFAGDFDEQISAEGQALYLNGEGPRKKAFLTIYDTALYLTEKGSDAKAIVEADHAMAVNLVIQSKLATASRISEAFREGLESSTGGDTEAIEDQTQTFLGVFDQGVVKGDTFQFLYVPEAGTKIIKNGDVAADIEGLEFKQALFGIWLSENSISDKLKKQLLGQ